MLQHIFYFVNKNRSTAIDKSLYIPVFSANLPKTIYYKLLLPKQFLLYQLIMMQSKYIAFFLL